MIESILFDLSGVLYDGDQVIPGAQQAVQRAQRSGIEVRFITNTSQKTRQNLLLHLHSLKFAVEETQLFTAVDAARQWLRQRNLRPFCLVHENIIGEFADFDQHNPNAVLIADAAEGFHYHSLNRAFQLCIAGAPLLGIGYNRYFKSGDQLVLDAGAFIKTIEFGAGVEAVIVGKPSVEFFKQVVASTSARPEHTLMVGDDVFGDVEGALNVGLQAALVRTGKYRPGDEDKVSGDFNTVDSVTEAVELALNNRG
ncbi:TIGR01458 family HAD-type hydrolase [Pseudomaricurvus alcaniphilus]|uniref:TIGR01458 family HAD-type hydrolase n=1 Tax=Pseudomaricurvus alcaniphilus TaxID=1166482 RepID=UPI0014080195|nr:TIGR01458 family HAD-type hydrolase [Pseudomaricurvus alcaniphilus]NHN35794.1 TIGR01458 family HAD-type hydrolase [Pseudomaricurvus alcaniphilus]